MTGYMYNPSKKVSEILSKFLEFDPEQLRLGIWSGNLSLHEVSLREDAVYPILNRHLKESNTASSQASNPKLDYCPPPARFKLVSSSIGSLEMKIPWKRLVWGPGDVEVKLRNVVLVVALESVEETEQRLAGGAVENPNDNDSKRQPWDFPGVAHNDPDGETELHQPHTRVAAARSANPELVRELHQTRLREAEKRLLEGRWSVNWIDGMRKKDQETIAKLAKEKEASDTEVHANSWLATATKDFFWRFCAGLVLEVENLKIIFVQDSVELGVVMPSIRLTNVKDSAPVTNTTHFEGSDASTFAAESAIGPDDVIYKGAETDEGEHIDKSIRVLGLGLFIRRKDTTPSVDGRAPPVRFAPDASTKEFIVRPVDCSFEYSFFYPTPPDKRKRKEITGRKESQDQTATTVASADGSSAGSSKRRRGKREKNVAPAEPTLSSSAVLSPSTQRKIGFDLGQTDIPKPSITSSLRQRRASTVGGSFAPNSRRQSIAFRPVPQRPASALRSSSTAASAPLVRPDNIASAYATAAVNSRDVIRLEAKMTVGAVEVIVSSSHYNLLMAFLSSCVRTRNGRPSASMLLELSEGGKVANRSLLVISKPASAVEEYPSVVSSTAVKSEAGDPEVRLRLQGFKSRRDASRKWWMYAMRLIVWELRERKRLRLTFQKRFLFFSWKTQTYRRREYVSLFISVHLDKRVFGDDTESLDELLAIEDELSIEQILLYRSIARAVFVRGEREMPESILGLRDNGATHVPEADHGGPDDDNVNRGSVQISTKRRQDVSSLLTMLENQGEVLRRRLREDDYSKLERFEPFLFPPSGAGNRLASVLYDDSTFAHTVDTKNVRNQRRKALDLLGIEGVAQERSAMFVSFTFNLDKVELAVVEDSMVGYDNTSTNLGSDINESDSASSFESNVSVLTDDQKFFKEAGDLHRSTFDSEVSDDPPVLSSTDFLIFNTPENVVLRVTVSPVLLSLLARSGGSRNANMKIGKVVAFGDSNRRFLHIGRSSKATPLTEVGMGASFLSSAGSDWGQEAPSNALSLSVIISNSTSVLECDSSTICAAADLDTFLQLDRFRRTNSLFPRRMLRRSLEEGARLHLLKQAVLPWKNVNSSVRFHGIELALPAALNASKTDAVDDDTNASEDDEKPNVAFRLTMIEIYSGSAVAALGEAADDVHASLASSGETQQLQPSNTTRTLRMIDVTEAAAGRPSIRANHWVVSASGIDVMMNFSPPVYYSWSRQSFLENSFDLEMFLTLNESSLGDFNRAKWEVTIRCSPVDMVLSSGRVARLCDVVSTLPCKVASDTSEAPLPTRLEVLSQFLVATIDFRVQRLRMSLENELDRSEGGTTRSKQATIRSILSSFLAVIASFDLSYPNEEALASAMQISIDRLTGQGLSLEDSWEVTNNALLTFIEACGTAVEVDALTVTESVESTITSCASLIRQLTEWMESDHVRYSFVLDLPEGLALSAAKLYYDRCASVCIPIVFVTDDAGIHILRVAPPDADGENDESEDSKVVSSNTSAVNDERVDALHGLSLRAVQLDQLHPFGRGGEPLTAISSDGGSGMNMRGTRETIYDAEVAEVELTFCRPVFENFVSCLLPVMSPLVYSKSSGEVASDDKMIAGSEVEGRMCRLVSVSSLSFQFLSDEYAPFFRLLLRDQLVKNDVSVKQSSRRDVMLSVGAFSLMNLTSEGEMYPEVFSDLSESSAIPLRVQVSDSTLSVQFQNVRMVLLQQFTNELMQYFISGRHGVGSFVALVRASQRSNNNDVSRRRSDSLLIEVRGLSLLLPRSTGSPDMVAVEVEKAVIGSSRQDSSFEMPSSSSPLRRNVERIPDSNSGKSVNRLSFELRCFRIFTALPLTLATTDEAGSPLFRFLHSIDGRAEAGKQVFCRKMTNPKTRATHDDLPSCTVDRVWQEITSTASSLDLIIDRAPHLRILVTDPGTDFSYSMIDLDMSVSQFALLLSIWYVNMQQLPVTFPLSAAQLEATAKPLSTFHDFPDYGTETYTALLLSPDALTTEVCICLQHLSWRFSGSSVVSDHETLSPPLALQVRHVTVHVTIDSKGVTRLGSGATFLSLTDHGRKFDRVVQTGSHEEKRSWADTQFGLSDARNLDRVLSQAFQLSVFMTPGWAMYNLGVSGGEVVLSDFSSVYKLLEFLTKYAKEPRLGNPSFQAAEHSRALKKELQDATGLNDVNFLPWPASTFLEFRLWLYRPRCFIPCNPFDASSSGVQVAVEAFRYGYSALATFASHEVASQALDLYFIETFCLDPGQASRQLIDGLCFKLRLDFNEGTKHTDISLHSALSDASLETTLKHRSGVHPIILEQATICRPFRQPGRLLGPTVCELTVIIELLPLVWKAVSGLFLQGEEDLPVGSDGSMRTDDVTSSAEPERTFSIVMRLNDIRVFSCDPVLGPHLPVAVLSIPRLDMSASQFALSGTGSVYTSAVTRNLENLQVVIRGQLWADYFKLGLTRSWEPLLEAYALEALYEKSHERGSGLSVMSDSPFHINVSSALLVILDEVIDSFRRSIDETFDETNEGMPLTTVGRRQGPTQRLAAEDSSGRYLLLHERPRGLAATERVPFAVRNMTGQELRLSKPEEILKSQLTQSIAVVSYVDHSESAPLNFLPSISLISNMSVVDVEFPGVPNGRRAFKDPSGVPPHTIYVQIPGFHWLQGVKVDTFGRSFADIVPSSQTVFDKARRDWRIQNVMKLFVEVGLHNGGRQVTLRSLFSITNRSSHKICVYFHPDPGHVPQESNSSEIAQADGEVEPGGVLQVPVLLTDSALRRSGTHLGSIWLRPSTVTHHPSFTAFLEDSKSLSTDSMSVEYSSKPIQLARLVSDSALLFENQLKAEVTSYETTTGIDLSCSVTHQSGRLAPFCYVVEVARSPLARAASPVLESEDSRNRSRVHGPVVYSLSVHPTFIVANLLPQKGRFELMHAVRKTVVWFADMEPGEEIAIHSVGLDAPLLLFINLGYCKTPVGEGALVHHGLDPPRGARDTIGLKSIGKAGKAVTKQIGKTLTKIGESPDKRGHERLFFVQNPQFFTRDMQGQDQAVKPSVNALGLDNDEFASTEAAGGKTFRIDTAVFFPSDVVAETTVVDGIGQRLTLNIENVRGGGGQRKISVFSPFWIVNSTEHPLRYRQEKGNTSFVCGTVSSPERDGSRPLEGGRAETNYGRPPATQLETLGGGRQRLQTIFSGMPGALASSPGVCDLPPSEVLELVDSNLELNEMVRLAFMFNFSEGVLSLGNQKLCVQLWDGTGTVPYASDWSQGLSLDSVGFSQVVGMQCKDGRTLELTAIVSVAPGILSGYTKVVRIVSRYFVVNSLPYPVRLWQDSSVFRPPGADSARQGSSRRTWRVARHTSRKNRREVNQYEALWGKETVIDERSKLSISGGSRAHPSALYIASLRHSEIMPFTLPDSRGERQLRIEVGGYWDLTPSVSADVPGEHTVKVTRAFDLKLTPHVSTRGSPEYIVKLSPANVRRYAGELGIWFETDWGNDKKVIVKAVKKESFAFQETDVHVGDELLSIDGEQVSRASFDDAMSRLRTRIAALTESSKLLDQGSGKQLRRSSLRLVGMGRGDRSASFGVGTGAPPLVLRFRTVEERLRRVRVKAARASDVNVSEATGFVDVEHEAETQRSAVDREPRYVKVDLRSVQHSYFLVIQEQDTVPYKIQNRSRGSTIFYRQKGCDAHPWQYLGPGKSTEYAWEEPLRAKRLSVRVALESAPTIDDDSTTGDSANSSTRMKRNSGRFLAWGSFFRHVKDEEDATFSPIVNVRLEEIGFRDILPFHAFREGDEPVNARYLELEVEVQGLSRVLVVNDSSTEDNSDTLKNELDSLKASRDAEMLRLEALQDFSAEIGDADDEYANDEAVSALMNTFPGSAVISARHQILVEVIEANGLSTDTFSGSCTPYCEVYVKCSTAGRFARLKKRDRRKTYFITNTVNPSWKDQVFVFDVSPEAVSATRGFSIKVCLRDYHPFGRHKLLGAAQVELHSLRDQNALVGWFPLAGRTGRHELENPLSYWGRGSVKLRLQWIYTPRAYLDYCIKLSERRVIDLEESSEHIRQHLHNKQEAEARRRDEVDGFQNVRIHDIVSRSSKPRNATQQHTTTKTSTAQPLPTVGGGVKSSAPTFSLPTPKEDQSIGDVKYARPMDFGKSPNRKHPTLKAKTLAIEALLSKTRQTVSRRDLSERQEPAFAKNGFNGTFPVTSFHSWPAAHVVFRDPDLSAAVVGEEVKVRISDTWLSRQAATPRPTPPMDVVSKFQLPKEAPKALAVSLNEHALSFSESRVAFERAAKRKMRSVIHPGGWLIVRPLTALNLSDAYTGMFVKLRHGAEVVVSETVDAKINPSWDYTDTKRMVSSEASQRQRRLDAITNLDVRPNDLHVRVPPQKTSGSIIVSVMGERRTANIQSVKELGILHLPLGASIAACIDGDDIETREATSAYLRWFPLMSPGDVMPTEGDYGLSFRPPESEKVVDTAFHEYFAPCIHLALLWVPDSDDWSRDENADGQSTGRDPTTANITSFAAEAREGSSAAPAVISYYVADIGRISAALIDSQRSFELVSVAASDIEFRFWATRAKTRVGISVGWLQVDQQHDDAREPVILAPTPSDFIGPVIQILAVQDNSRSKTEILTFDFIDLSLEEFDLTLEEKILFDLFDFFKTVRLRKGLLVRRSQPSSNDAIESSATESLLLKSAIPSNLPTLSDLLFANANENDTHRKVYIEQLFLGVVKVNLSYVKGKRQSWELTSGGWVDKGGEGDTPYRVRLVDLTGGERLFGNLALLFHERSESMLRWSLLTSDDDLDENVVGKGSQSFPELFAALFPNISDAPIRLQGKALNHVLESPTEILQSVQKYYVNETLRQVYRIIGSLDFVGNPTLLFTSFVSGVRDLVITPSRAFMKSPTDASGVGLGVAQGTLSLFSHSTSGFFGFCAKVSAAAGQGLTWLTLDPDYRNWHRDQIVVEVTNLNRVWKRRGIQGVRASITRPVMDIFIGIGSAISGVFILPYKGYVRGGSTGLLVGVAGAASGVIVKPIIGVLDAMAHFGATIHDLAKSVNVLDRRRQPALRLRLPYTFGIMQVLSPFNQNASRAVRLLRQFPIRGLRQSSEAPPETLVHVEVLQNTTSDTYLIASSYRILLVRLRKETSGALVPSVGWEVSLSDKSKVSSRMSEHGHSGVGLTVTVSKPAEEDPDRIRAVHFDDDAGAPESQEVTFNRYSDPDLNGLSTVKLGRSESLQSQLALDAQLEGQFQGTARGEEGELLEWFSVLAEYQHRPQLTRMHNVISCLTGNFSSISYDPSLGRAWSTEGYTSFGMFYFHPGGVDWKLRDDGRQYKLVEALEELPWVDVQTLQEVSALDVDSQKRYLADFRMRATSPQETLELSRKLGGPDWLVVARAEGFRVASKAETIPESFGAVPSDESQRPAERTALSRPSRLRRWATTPLATIPDGRILESLNFRSPFRRDLGDRNRSVETPSDDGNATSNAAPSGRRDELLDDSNSDGEESGPMSSSFATAAEHMGDWSFSRPRPDRGGQLTAVASASRLDSFRTAHESLRASSVSDASIGIDAYGEGIGSDVDRQVLYQTGPVRPNAPPDWTTTTEYEVRTRYRQTTIPPRPDESRMDRMERLLEGLLIFASEQALLQRQVPPAPPEGASPEIVAASLREEMVRLRSELHGQAQSRDGAPRRQQQQTIPPTPPTSDELAQLRSEIADLKARLRRAEDLDDVPFHARSGAGPPRSPRRSSTRDSDSSLRGYSSARLDDWELSDVGVDDDLEPQPNEPDQNSTPPEQIDRPPVDDSHGNENERGRVGDSRSSTNDDRRQPGRTEVGSSDGGGTGPDAEGHAVPQLLGRARRLFGGTDP